MATKPFIHCIPDHVTGTAQYVVSCKETNKAVIIDPVLDFDFDSGRFSHCNLEKIQEYLKNNELNVQWVLETHVHAGKN